MLHGDALWAVAAVLFQAELAFQGVVDRFDDLAQRAELAGAAAGSFVFAGRADQLDTVVGEEAFELGRDVALVGDECLAGAAGEQGRVVVEHVDGDVALVDLRVGHSEGDRQPGRCAHEVQSQPPEEPRVRRAVAVAGPAGEPGTFRGRHRPAALDRGRVDQPGVVGPHVGVLGEEADHRLELHARAAQPLVVAGLTRQIREQMSEMLSGVTQPASLRGEPQQRLHHRQRQQLGVGQLRGDPDLRAPRRAGRDVPSTCHRSARTVQSRGCPDRRPSDPPRSTWVSNADHGRPPLSRRGPSPLGIGHLAWPDGRRRGRSSHGADGPRRLPPGRRSSTSRCSSAPPHVTEVRLSTDEVASICPVTSQPDLSTVVITYMPGRVVRRDQEPQALSLGLPPAAGVRRGAGRRDRRRGDGHGAFRGGCVSSLTQRARGGIVVSAGRAPARPGGAGRRRGPGAGSMRRYAGGRVLCCAVAHRATRRPAQRRGPDRAVDARRQPHQVAPRPHDVVLRDVRARTRTRPATPFDERFGFLFNSYYEAVGARHARPERGLITRPGITEIAEYRRTSTPPCWSCSTAVWPTRTCRAARARACTTSSSTRSCWSWTSTTPCRATRCARRTASCRGATARRRPATGWIDHDGGIVEIGHDGDGFAFDNEGPRHEVLLRPFRIAGSPVTCGDWLAFMADGGYRRPDLWMSDGWATVQAQRLGGARCTGSAAAANGRRSGSTGCSRWTPPRRSSTSAGTRPTPSPVGGCPLAVGGRVGDRRPGAGRRRRCAAVGTARCGSGRPARTSPYPGFRPGGRSGRRVQRQVHGQPAGAARQLPGDAAGPRPADLPQLLPAARPLGVQRPAPR